MPSNFLCTFLLNYGYFFGYPVCSRFLFMRNADEIEPSVKNHFSLILWKG